MRFECRICVLRLAFHVFIQIRYEHPHQKAAENEVYNPLSAAFLLIVCISPPNWLAISVYKHKLCCRPLNPQAEICFPLNQRFQTCRFALLICFADVI